VVSLSTTETEFIVAVACACQAVWLHQVLKKLGHCQDKSIIVHCDNTSAIKLAKNPVMHGHRCSLSFLPRTYKEWNCEIGSV